ncbi:hypothetical protein BV898_14237 [Hypsibius exemplaris]|uniref:Uncharacterized protein n=1 Tax=Hypsibius exemplaris TaxID=2072580 RepID=A0A1W0W8B0_HYPEX|nr:hypothetical protein BV898_14237 [Hypsibius exemplaris]
MNPVRSGTPKSVITVKIGQDKMFLLFLHRTVEFHVRIELLSSRTLTTTSLKHCLTLKPTGQPDRFKLKPTGQPDRFKLKPPGQPDRSKPKPTGQPDRSKPKPTGKPDRSKLKPTGQPDRFKPKPPGQPDRSKPKPPGQPDPLKTALILNLAQTFRLEHAMLVLKEDPVNKKVLFRAGRAHYELRQCRLSAVHFFVAVNPSSLEADKELKRCNARLAEQENDVNVYKLYLSEKLEPEVSIETADYCIWALAINVKAIVGKGRGTSNPALRSSSARPCTRRMVDQLPIIMTATAYYVFAQRRSSWSKSTMTAFTVLWSMAFAALYCCLIHNTQGMQYTEIFRDDFNDYWLDPNKWNVVQEPGIFNGEAQHYTHDEVWEEHGFLIIRSQ